MNYEGVCFYLSIFLAGGDACVPGQTMVRPGDRTSLKAGGDACAPGNYEGGGNMEPAKDD